MTEAFAPFVSLLPYIGALLVLLAMPAAVIPKVQNDD